MKEKIKSFFEMPIKYILVFLLWSVLGGFMGVIGGGVGALFSHALEFAAELRGEHPWLVYLLPFGGLLIAVIYGVSKLSGSNTNTVFETVRDEKQVPFLLAPAVFVGTFITHLFGGSAGREGAALQIGGSIASLIGKVIKIDERRRHILVMCGMSALFSALFGTPVGACIFAIEIASSGRLYTAALYPCCVSSVIAHLVATRLKVTPEHYEVGTIPELALTPVAFSALVGIAAAIVSIVFCICMHKTHHLIKRLLPNKYIRTVVGGTVVILLTILVGNSDYNGSGVHIIAGIFEGASVPYFGFCLR